MRDELTGLGQSPQQSYLTAIVIRFPIKPRSKARQVASSPGQKRYTHLIPSNPLGVVLKLRC